MAIAGNESTVAMFAFTIILGELHDIDDGLANRLFEAGCSDASLGCCEGVVSLEFDRESDSLGEAVKSAIRDIQAAGYRPVRISLVDD